MSSPEIPELSPSQILEVAPASRGFVHVLAPESRTESSLDSRISKSPKFRLSAVEVPGFRVFMTSPLHRIKIPELCTFANSRLRRSRTSWIREFPAPEKHTLRVPLDCDVSRVMCFPEFPNTSPSGKRVDSDDPIPRTFRKFSKKRHPRNVGGDTRHSRSQRRLNRGALRETAPPRPYK
jgi:hypothetical protein